MIDYNAVLTRLSRRIYRANVHNDLFADHSYDVVSRLPDIKVPTLVFCGENDCVITSYSIHYTKLYETLRPTPFCTL